MGPAQGGPATGLGPGRGVQATGVDTGLDRCGPRLSRPAGAGEPACLAPGAGKVAGREGGLGARAPERTAEIAGGVEGTGIPAGRAGEELAGFSSLCRTAKRRWRLHQQAAVWEASLAEWEERLRGLEMERRRLRNRLQELKGNLRAFCRVCPTLPGDSTPSPGSFQFGPSDLPTRLSGMGP